jgi:hypothetical protein
MGLMWWLSDQESERVGELCGALAGIGYELMRAAYPFLNLPPLSDFDLED